MSTFSEKRNGSGSPECWCGNTDLSYFSPAYLKCQACETLVAVQMPGTDIAKVTNDERDFYGREYWFSHQENDLGFPNIKIRSRTDLPERCLQWLRIVLKYKLPPGQVLELGSAHGGFVAMLRWAGFDAIGLELSPWVVEFARKLFDIPVLLGPLENQQIKPSSLDMIILMDVLEHLPDPVSTMRHCLNLLKSDGILVIQTPCLPEGKTYNDLIAQNDPFLEQLKDVDHLYLFSRRSIQEFFHRLGADHMEFESAFFAFYDLFLAVGRVSLRRYLPDEIEKALSTTASGRLVQALLDLDDQFREMKKRYGESETDRALRLEQINKLTELLKESENDRAERLKVIENLSQELDKLKAERTAIMEVIKSQEIIMNRLPIKLLRSLKIV